MSDEQQQNLPPLKTWEEITKDELKPYLLDPSRDYGDPLWGFEYGGVPFASLGGLTAIKAPQKNGKTFLCTILAGAAMSKTHEYMGIKCNILEPRILWFDTEQHPRHIKLIYDRVCKIAGLAMNVQQEGFNMLHLRKADIGNMKTLITHAIELFKPNIVFVDGVVDLVKDPNNYEESRELLMKLDYIAEEKELLIIAVLHINPQKDYTSGELKMRGHLGTNLAQLATDVFLCLKNKELHVFKAEHTESRDTAGIPDFSFTIRVVDLNGKRLSIPVLPNIDDRNKELQCMLQELLSKQELWYQSDVIKAIRTKGYSDSQARKKFGEAKTRGILIYEKEHKQYRLSESAESKDNELPF